MRGSILAAIQPSSLGSEPSHYQRTLLQQTSTVSTFCNRPVTSASPSTFILAAVRGSLAEPTLATSPVLSCRTCPRRRVCPTHEIIMRLHIDSDIDIDIDSDSDIDNDSRATRRNPSTPPSIHHGSLPPLLLRRGRIPPSLHHQVHRHRRRHRTHSRPSHRVRLP